MVCLTRGDIDTQNVFYWEYFWTDRPLYSAQKSLGHMLHISCSQDFPIKAVPKLFFLDLFALASWKNIIPCWDVTNLTRHVVKHNRANPPPCAAHPWGLASAVSAGCPQGMPFQPDASEIYTVVYMTSSYRPDNIQTPTFHLFRWNELSPYVQLLFLHILEHINPHQMCMRGDELLSDSEKLCQSLYLNLQLLLRMLLHGLVPAAGPTGGEALGKQLSVWTWSRADHPSHISPLRTWEHPS